MVVVRDEDYHSGLTVQKLQNAGFNISEPSRRPRPEVLRELPDPQGVVKEINSRYNFLDQSTITHCYPACLPTRRKPKQVVLSPNSFAHLDMDPSAIFESPSAAYDRYGNVLYPSERTLMENLVKAVVDDKEGSDPESYVHTSARGDLLELWVSQMATYLGIGVDNLDDSGDLRAVKWYSTRFGRIYVEKNGPMDHRISKRLGSGKDIVYDMSGARVADS